MNNETAKANVNKNKIYLGNNQEGRNVELDFDEENIKFVLLAGQTGSGKSIFHNNLYNELLKKYSSDEIGFVFLDMTRIDFGNWPTKYLIKPIIHDSREAIDVLYELANLETSKKVFVHIEECDMVYVDRKKVEGALEKFKEKNNFHIVYSTSRIDRDYLADWINRFIDLKVVFNTNEDDSEFLLGNKIANQFKNPGERVLAFNNLQIVCQPFSNEEVVLLNKFNEKLIS